MQFTPGNRQQWRDWLTNNHARETEVWLVFIKKHTGRANLSYGDAVEEALCFGWIDGIKRSIDQDRYEHRFSPRKPGSKWSATNKARVQRLLKSGRMAPAGKQAVADAKVNGRWDEPVTPARQVDMPPEFAQRLQRNRKAATFFASLAPSCQREYIAWIAAAKRSETRQRRLDEAMDLLSKGKKLGMR